VAPTGGAGCGTGAGAASPTVDADAPAHAHAHARADDSTRPQTREEERLVQQMLLKRLRVGHLSEFVGVLQRQSQRNVWAWWCNDRLTTTPPAALLQGSAKSYSVEAAHEVWTLHDILVFVRGCACGSRADASARWLPSARYKTSRLRLMLPDGWCLGATFGPYETVHAIQQCVSEVCSDPRPEPSDVMLRTRWVVVSGTSRFCTTRPVVLTRCVRGTQGIHRPFGVIDDVVGRCFGTKWRASCHCRRTAGLWCVGVHQQRSAAMCAMTCFPSFCFLCYVVVCLIACAGHGSLLVADTLEK